MTTIHELPTPALLLDLDILEANIRGMADRCRTLGVGLRPHVKTHKCIEIGRRQQQSGAVGITVSTLPEARAFVDAGFTDLTWAFPLNPSRLPELRELANRCTVRIVVDSAQAIDAAESLGTPLHVWLEVDCGYHRTGVDPASPRTVELAARLTGSASLVFDGLLSHSGHAYHGPTTADVLAVAREERDTLLRFAEQLRAEGLPVPGISVGSTPAMSVVDHLEGITEARPGNYVFHDYTQVVLGSCGVPQCAVTVLATVVSAQPNASHCVTDAGALALSRDPGRPPGPATGFGRIYRDYARGVLEPGLRLTALSQEHGRVSGALPVGSTVRILPNHSCLTVACFDRYHVVRGEELVDEWPIRRER
jgi:D-serine deaminase-like pyridoxal phosphate-dependent protein